MARFYHQNNKAMRFIIHFLILFSIPAYFKVSSGNSESHPKATTKQYCNDRFDFCLKYPEQLFTKSWVADNNDGIRLGSEDGKLYVEASGSNNILNWQLVDIHNAYFDGLKDQYPDIETMSFQVLGNRSESVFRYDKQVAYYENVLRDGHYITLIIKVPQGMEALLISLKNEVALAVQI